MPEITRLIGRISCFELDPVEREATPETAVKLVFSLIWLDSNSRILSQFLIFWVSIAVAPPFTIGYRKRTYSLLAVPIRITLRLTRP